MPADERVRRLWTRDGLPVAAPFASTDMAIYLPHVVAAASAPLLPHLAGHLSHAAHLQAVAAVVRVRLRAAVPGGRRAGALERALVVDDSNRGRGGSAWWGWRRGRRLAGVNVRLRVDGETTC